MRAQRILDGADEGTDASGLDADGGRILEGWLWLVSRDLRLYGRRGGVWCVGHGRTRPEEVYGMRVGRWSLAERHSQGGGRLRRLRPITPPRFRPCAPPTTSRPSYSPLALSLVYGSSRPKYITFVSVLHQWALTSNLGSGVPRMSHRSAHSPC